MKGGYKLVVGWGMGMRWRNRLGKGSVGVLWVAKAIAKSRKKIEAVVALALGLVV